MYAYATLVLYFVGFANSNDVNVDNRSKHVCCCCCCCCCCYYYCISQVIGDKKGGHTAGILLHERGMNDLQEIMDTVGVPLKFIHIVRNPFDNIATMSLRELKDRETATMVTVLDN